MQKCIVNSSLIAGNPLELNYSSNFTAMNKIEIGQSAAEIY